MVVRLDPPFEVKHHRGEGFAPDMPDDEWLAIVGAKKWIVISHDAKWHREEGPLMAIQQHRISCFYLWGAQMPMWNKTALLAKVFP
jgi:PIN like domain